MQTETVRVVRAFYYQGKPTKVGDVLEVPKIFAREMIAAKKAEEAKPAARVDAKPAAAEPEKGGPRAR